MLTEQRLTRLGPAPIEVLHPLSPPSATDEANHRFANSLQLLATMVSIEARGIADPIALDVLNMMLARIGAIAGVHRQLYEKSATTSIDLGTYLEDLGDLLERSHADARTGRRVLVRAEAVKVLPEVATAVGVIVTELVSNACKYAYRADQPGDIWIALRAVPMGGFRLDVSDRGCGRALHAAPQGSGLGSRLIELMARQLGGQHDWCDAQPGTRFSLWAA